jgi:hypothetical protein
MESATNQNLFQQHDRAPYSQFILSDNQIIGAHCLSTTSYAGSESLASIVNI